MPVDKKRRDKWPAQSLTGSNGASQHPKSCHAKSKVYMDKTREQVETDAYQAFSDIAHLGQDVDDLLV